VAGGAAAVAVGFPYVMKARPHAREHVFLVIADAMRADVVGKVVNGREVTPNINALAREGTCFTRAFSASPFTKFSMASIFSGMYPPGHGVEHHLFTLPDCMTMQRFLSKRGYYCLGLTSNPYMVDEIGPRNSRRPMDFGFNSSFNYYWCAFGKNNFDPPAPVGLEQLRAYVTGETLNEFLFDALFERKVSVYAPDSPLFVYLHYMDSHEPWLKTKPIRGITGEFHAQKSESVEDCHRQDVDLIYKLLFSDFPKENAAPAEVERLKAIYLEASAYADRCIGDMIARLKQRGMYEDSTIIFTADHGDELLEHGRIGHCQNLFNTSLEVPLVIKRRGMPRAEVANRVSNAMLLPTLAEWFGDEIAHTNLVSLMPYATDAALGNFEVFASFYGKDKVILADGREAMNHEDALLYFNAAPAADPAELRPLAQDAEALAALKRARFQSERFGKEAGIVRRFSTRDWQNPFARSQDFAAAQLENSGKITAEESARLKSLGEFIPEADRKRLAGDLARIKINASALSSGTRDQLRALGYLH